jgi:hypothetical protein
VSSFTGTLTSPKLIDPDQMGLVAMRGSLLLLQSWDRRAARAGVRERAPGWYPPGRMRSALAASLLLLSLDALAADDEALPPDVACKEDKATCKEDCSLDYGMSEATRAKVPKCLADCEQAEVICLARHVAKRRAGQAKADRERYAAPAAEEAAAPPMDDDLPPVRKRTSTHAADLKATPDKTPEGYQEKVFSRPVPETPKVQPPPPAPPPPDPAKPPPPAKKKAKKKLAAPAPTIAE